MTRLYTYNRSFFDKKDLTSCYWAGFLAADGTIHQEREICLRLARKDRSHLNKFRRAIDGNQKIRQISVNRQYPNSIIDSIEVHGKDFVIALGKNFSVVPNKTFILLPPALNKESHIRAFIRGYFDGDGCLTNTHDGHFQMTLTSGSKAILEWILIQINKFVASSNRYTHVRHHAAWRLSFGGQQIVDILSWLYKDSTNETRLTRKYCKFQKSVLWYATRPIRKFQSKYIGVSRQHKTNRWRTCINIRGVQLHIGSFKTERQAAIAYNNAIRRYRVHRKLNHV